MFHADREITDSNNHSGPSPGLFGILGKPVVYHRADRTGGFLKSVLGGLRLSPERA